MVSFRKFYNMKRTICFVCVLLIAALLGTSAGASSDAGRVYCRNAAKEKKIALTFDDGPHPRFTKEILDILKEYGIKATFFIIGINAENYPESLKLIVDSGCEIGNHTYSHHRTDKMTSDELEQEIRKCEDVLYSMTGIKPKLFRPPQGRVNGNLLKVSDKLGYSVILWSIDTLDWSHNPSDKICASVKNNLINGDIILMHDYISGKNTTCEALRRLIPELLSKGYEFVTVSELIN